MNFIVKSKKTLLLIVFLVALIIIVLVLNIFVTPQRSTDKPEASPSPTAFQTALPKELQSAPTISAGGEKWVDQESAEIQASAAEINKLSSTLPYKKEFIASTGVNISILVPERKLQDSEWSLNVNIFGPDYQVTKDDPDYNLMQQSFLEASSQVFSWIKSQGADPNKIYIVWGDKEFIRSRADEWLKSR